MKGDVRIEWMGWGNSYNACNKNLQHYILVLLHTSLQDVTSPTALHHLL